jgi:MFS family permease
MAKLSRPGSPFRDATSWYMGLSAYWFATSFKWFVMFLLLGLHVARMEGVTAEQKNTWWGIIAAIGAIEAMIGPAIFGWLSDRTRSRFGRRTPYLAIGAAMTSLVLVFLGEATTPWTLLVAYLFLQISDDVATGPYAALIPDLVPEEHRGRASGMMGMLHQGAQIFAVVVSLLLGDILLIFYFVAALNIVCALVVLAVVKEPSSAAFETPADVGPVRVRKRNIPSPAALVAAWTEPFRSADFRWVWMTRFLNQLGFYMILLYVANYLTDVVAERTVLFTHGWAWLNVLEFRIFGTSIGGSPEQAALMIALGISLTGGLSAYFAGRSSDKIGRKRVILIGGWIMFGALVPFALIANFSVIVLLAVAFGFGFGAYQSANWALVADVLPSEEDRGKDMGIWQMSIAAPQVVSGSFGFVIDYFNRQAPGMGYKVTFLVASLVFLASTQLIRRVKGST